MNSTTGRFRAIILHELLSGVKTTEDLRIAIRETKIVAYSHLRRMVDDGLIQQSRPKQSSAMRKYRLTEKGRDLATSPPILALMKDA